MTENGYKIGWICLLVFGFQISIFAQDQSKIDLLEKRLSEEKNDSAKVEILYSLFKEYSHQDIENAKVYNDRQFQIAEKSKNNYAKGLTYHTKGHYQFTISAFKSSIKSFNQSLLYAGKGNYQKLILSNYNRLAAVYNIIGDNDSALFYIHKAISLSKKTNDFENLALGYLEFGNYYNNVKKYDESVKAYLKVDSISNKKDGPFKSIHISALLNISFINVNLRNDDAADEYAQKALKLAKDSGNKEDYTRALNASGLVDFNKGRYEEAEKKFNEALAYNISVKNKFREADNLFLLGLLNGQQNKTDKAKDYYKRCLKIRKEISDQIGMVVALKNIGQILFKEKNYAESKKYYTEALAYSREMALLENEVISLYHLAEINYQLQDLDESTEMFRLYLPLKDSLNEIRNFETVAELETRYSTAEKEQQIKLLSAENELNEERRKNQLMIFGVLAALLLIGGLSVFYSYRNKIKTAEKIKELNEMKSRFFANISHEFRTPLTLIKSPLQSLQNLVSGETEQKQLARIDQNANRMLELVDQLLELSKIDNGNYTLLLKERELKSFIQALIDPFEYEAKQNQIQFISTINLEEGKYSFDADVLQKIISNLLGNALKYTPEHHEIHFNATIQNENLQLEIANTGTDLTQKEVDKIFERFFQNDSGNQGFGIGLALVKELVELYKGNLKTELKNGRLSFKISIPLVNADTSNISIESYAHPISMEPIDEIVDTAIENEKPILLIVDDNHDIRNLIHDIFVDQFEVLEAVDAESALEISKNTIPDCIISDVMMPGMDGFEFTQIIKTNELTSFIPVILLTAKSSDEDRLESLKSQADKFITKPFKNDILIESVHQLLKERKTLRNRYSKELILKPIDIAVNTYDEKFLIKIYAVFEENFTNPDFSVDEFSAKMGLSRMQLHRKLKSLLNVSTTEFIRNERVKAAAEMMKKGHKNISEIAYTVGFNNLSYFNKCFKQTFDETPSEFISKL